MWLPPAGRPARPARWLRASRHGYRYPLQRPVARRQAEGMKRDPIAGRWPVRAGRRARPEPKASAAPSAPMAAAHFVTLLKRGQLAAPQHAELRAGKPHRVRPVTGQAAGVLQRLRRELEVAVVGAGLQASVSVRPLVRLGGTDLWRPQLALFPAREGAALTTQGATVEAARALLVVELGEGAAEAERLAGFASGGVGELWSLCLCQGWTVRYRSPWAGRFQSRTLWYPGEAVPVAALAGVQVEALEEGYRPATLLAGGPDCRNLPW